MRDSAIASEYAWKFLQNAHMHDLPAIGDPVSYTHLDVYKRQILRRVRGKKNKEINIYKIGKFTFDTQKQILATEGKQKMCIRDRSTAAEINSFYLFLFQIFFPHFQFIA